MNIFPFRHTFYGEIFLVLPSLPPEQRVGPEMMEG
jgi:hypothetical protein